MGGLGRGHAVGKALAYGLVLVIGLELAVWEAFLVAARPLGSVFPVAALLAVLGNVLVGRAGARVLGRPLGAAVPGLLWLVVAVVLGTRRPEGDLVVTNTGRGVAFLVAGAAAAAAVAALSGARGPVTTPEAPERR